MARPGARRTEARALTMLFTDIEGSTALLQRIGERYDRLLQEHRGLIRAAIERHDGTEIGTEGDSFFVLFERPTDGVAAAVDAQRALEARASDGDEPFRVRMGLHTGDVRFIDDDPAGLAVHQAHRIASAAHGGQILASETVRALCADDGGGVGFLDLGEHRLKDLLAPVRLLQVTHPDLPDGFPPPRTLEARRHNLPVELTSFVGRANELAEIRDLLSRGRMVTLTGAGGVGKTRLALQAAADMLDAFQGGVWLADLAPILEPALVPAILASALGIQ